MRVRAFPVLIAGVLASATVGAAEPPTGPTLDAKPRDPIHVGVEVAGGKLTTPATEGVRISGLEAASPVRADHVTIDATSPDTNALYVSGVGTDFTLSDSSIRVAGGGTFEFSGFGAGALVAHGATLTLRRVKIQASGAGASAIMATTNGVARIFDSEVVSLGGPLPPGTWQPPIGVSGSARTSLVTYGGRLYYYDSKIIADGWGAFSTDGGGGYVECNRCVISTIKSGYGVFADAAIAVTVNDSRIDAVTYAGIVAGNGIFTLNNTMAKSRGEGIVVMNVLSTGQEIGTLAINGGELRAAKDAFLVRSANINITLNGATVHSDQGVLLHVVASTDSFSSKSPDPVAGVSLTIVGGSVSGDVVNEEAGRAVRIQLAKGHLAGAVHGAVMEIGVGGSWLATANSDVALVRPADAARLDAKAGVTVRAMVAPDTHGPRQLKLKSGGRLELVEGSR